MKNHAKRGVKRHNCARPPFPGPSQGRFRMARHQLTGGGGIAFQRSGVGDWVALLSKGFTQRHHQSTHFSFFRGRHGITMSEQGGYCDGVQGELEIVKEKRIDKVSRSWSLHHSPSFLFHLFSLHDLCLTHMAGPGIEVFPDWKVVM